MILFRSLQSVTIWTVIVTVLLVWLGSRKMPFTVISSSYRTLRSSRKLFFTLVSTIFIFVVNNLELYLENSIHITWDLTPVIYDLEGNFVQSIQQLFYHPIVTQFVGFFYLVVFQALVIASIVIYMSSDRTKLAIAVCFAVIINYVVAIPFYIFAPVNEVWFYPPSEVQFLMLDIFPTFEEEYRCLSGLNNCFPSLHTSISVTVAILGFYSRIRCWQWFTAISAVIIVFSILYLGIHWFSDMLAGLVLAVIASWIGIRVSGFDSSNTSKPILAHQMRIHLSAVNDS